jgi:hypothetical protein
VQFRWRVRENDLFIGIMTKLNRPNKTPNVISFMVMNLAPYYKSIKILGPLLIDWQKILDEGSFYSFGKVNVQYCPIGVE